MVQLQMVNGVWQWCMHLYMRVKLMQENSLAFFCISLTHI